MNEVREEVVLANTYGLHARPASRFVQLANTFESVIYLGKEGREVNAKSIMEVMLLGAERGTRLSLRAVGKDASEAVPALAGLIKHNFKE
jgi:phosphocarrier protein